MRKLRPVIAAGLLALAPPAYAAGNGSVVPQACHITYVSHDGYAHNCSGALIAARIVATAAHCFRGGAQSIKGAIRVGCGYVDKTGPRSFSYREQFEADGVRLGDNRDIGSDFAFLRLTRDASISPMRLAASASELNARYTVPSPVGTDRLIRSDAICALAGFGADADGELRYRELDYAPGTRTKIYVGDRHLIIDLLTHETRGTRSGDSGGPLACRLPGESEWVLVGVTSNGFFNAAARSESGGGASASAASSEFHALLRRSRSEWKL